MSKKKTTMTDKMHETIEMAGGIATRESCPKIISPSQFEEIGRTISFLTTCYEMIVKDLGLNIKFSIQLVNSSAFSCRVRELAKDEFLVFVPIGMPARARVLAHLLLRYWGYENRILILRSPLDNMPHDYKSVPQLLRPLFVDDQKFENYWDALNKLDNTVEYGVKTENEILELVHLALVFLLSHEFAHILHGHFELIERCKTEDFALSKDEILRGIELDADAAAAAITMKVMKWGIDMAKMAERQDDLVLGWLRLSYVATMLFGIFDAQRKYFGAYDAGRYNHPTIRFNIFEEGVLHSVAGAEPIQALLRMNFNEGWQRCMWAFNDLSFDAKKGLFGEWPKEGYDLIPLQSMLPGISASSMKVEGELTIEAKKLVYQIRKLLPIFQTPKPLGVEVEKIAQKWSKKSMAAGSQEKIANARQEIVSYSQKGGGLLAQGNTELAVEYFEKCLSLAREIGDRQEEGNALGNLGVSCLGLDLHRAIEYLELSLAIYREVGDRRGEGASLGMLGVAYADLGEIRRAIEFDTQYLNIAREIGDRQDEVSALLNLSKAYASLGDQASVEDMQNTLMYFKQWQDAASGGR